MKQKIVELVEGVLLKHRVQHHKIVADDIVKELEAFRDKVLGFGRNAVEYVEETIVTAAAQLRPASHRAGHATARDGADNGMMPETPAPTNAIGAQYDKAQGDGGTVLVDPTKELVEAAGIYPTPTPLMEVMAKQAAEDKKNADMKAKIDALAAEPGEPPHPTFKETGDAEVAGPVDWDKAENSVA